MLDTLRKLYDILSPAERRKSYLLFFMMLAMGLFEAVGAVSVMPFVAVVANPDLVNTNPWLNAVYTNLGFADEQAFLIFLGGVLLALICISLAFKALTHYAIARFVQMRNYHISVRLFEGYLAQPYTWFLGRHSADLAKRILGEVHNLVRKALQPFMELVANFIVALCIIAVVVLADPVVALTAVAILGVLYGLIYFVLRGYLMRIGTDRFHANRERFQIAQESLGGIKDVKVLALENGYVNAFRRPAYRYAHRKASAQIIGELPEFFLRALAMGGIVAILLVLLITREGGLAAILPLLALYAYAGTRLLPALQKVYKALTTLRFGKPIVDSIHADLREATERTAAARKAAGRPSSASDESLPLRDRIELCRVTYTYPQAARPALQDLDITIPARTTVGFVGATGAGKTTVIDVLLGLLVPDTGEFRVDGTRIDADNVRRWQRNLGYVPQQIFLTDDTVAANIAFGVERDAIDPDAVERAARIAELHEFIVEELPHGYDTLVGERGVRLSGGQRQRIGIARALYHDPDVLVLDEATSALDNNTEKAIMETVRQLGRDKTIILIAHRLTTVQACDRIFMLEEGRLLATGSHAELMQGSETFRSLAGLEHPTP